jgi:hypothetical protein
MLVVAAIIRVEWLNRKWDQANRDLFVAVTGLLGAGAFKIFKKEEPK